MSAIKEIEKRPAAGSRRSLAEIIASVKEHSQPMGDSMAPPRRGRGRPSRSVNGVRSHKDVMVGLTPAMIVALDDKAEKLGRSRSDLIREAVQRTWLKGKR